MDQNRSAIGVSDQSAILVTGGSGFVGRRVVSRLANKGETVVCMYHHRLPEPMANVYPVCSDMGSAELIAAPLRGVKTVVHLAWEGSFVGPQDRVSWNVNSNHLPRNIRMLKNLIEAMERAGTERIVFLSAIGANRKTSVPFLQEKYLAEFFILNSKIPQKVILRSSVICGGGSNHDKFLKSILNVMKFPGVYPVPQMHEELAPIHIDDITDVLAKACTSSTKNPSALLEITGNERFPIEELFKLVSSRYVKGTKIPLRGFLGSSLLPFFERDSRVPENTARLTHYLTLGNKVDDATKVENPLAEIIPRKYHSFKDLLNDSHSVG